MPSSNDDVGAVVLASYGVLEPVVGAQVDESRADIYYSSAVDEINQATADVDALIAALIASVADELNGATANANSLGDELVGQLDVILSDSQAQQNKVLTAQTKDVAKSLGTVIDELGFAGFTLPYTAAEMGRQAEGDFIALVAQATPALAPLLGYTPSPPEPTFGTQEPYSNVVNPGAGAFGVSEPGDPLGSLPLPPPPVFGSLPPAGGTPQTVQASATAPSGSCCPAPVNVTVVVPPISIPTAAPAPAASAPVPPKDKQGSVCIEPTDDLRQKGLIFYDPGIGCWRYVIGLPLQCPAPAPAPKLPEPTPTPPPPPVPPTAQPAPLLAPTASSGLPPATFASITWNDLDACKYADQAVINPATTLGSARVDQPKASSGPLETYLDSKLSWKGAFSLAFAPFAAPMELAQLASAWAQASPTQVKALESAADRLATDTMLGAVAPQSVPNKQAAAYYGARLAAAGFAERQTTMPLSYLYTSDQYLYQYANPQYLPNQIRIDGAYLQGQISDSTWACWTRANGNLPEPARRVMLADQVKPNLPELLTLYRRGHVSKVDLPKRLRQIGVLEPAYVEEWLAATKVLPTQSDLIRFMVRDAADDQTAQRYDYDKDFEKKYAGPLKYWAEALGIDETYFRYSWRSHWVVPSDTRLEEMFHRLRPDRPEVTEWDAIAKEQGEGKAEALLGPKPPVVTLADVREALEVNDVAPRWVDAQVAIGYTPINRTDAVRAYQIGAFDEARLRHAFLDVGYSPADADTLVRFHSQDKARKRANVTGTWSVRKITTYFKRGFLSREQAYNLMRPLTASNTEVDRTLNAAEEEVAADTRAAAIRGVQRGFMTGEFSTDQARQMITGFGADKGISERLITRWTIERDSRYKRLSATQAADMLKKGLIGAEELRRRLKNLGYAQRDADLILARAIQVEGAADGLAPAQLDTAIGEAIRSRKDAANIEEGGLIKRLSTILKEVTRITNELNKRRAQRGEDPINPFQVVP